MAPEAALLAHTARVWLAEASRNRRPGRARWHARCLAAASRARAEYAAALLASKRIALPSQLALAF